MVPEAPTAVSRFTLVTTFTLKSTNRLSINKNTIFYLFTLKILELDSDGAIQHLATRAAICGFAFGVLPGQRSTFWAELL